MKYIEAVFNQNYISVILAVFLLLFAIKEIIDLISYFKEKGRIKTGSEQDKENVESRLITLEKHDNWQYKEIGKISDGVDKLNKSFLTKEINDLRWELLDFCSALSNGRVYNREAFEHIFRTYEQYEQILVENNMTNGYVKESMQVVREIYHQKLVNGEFK